MEEHLHDNAMYEYQLTQQSTEPDIYFDEHERVDDIKRAIPYLRILFAQFIKASDGDMNKLQTIMCLFSGHSLREVSQFNKKSHESNRAVLESIKNTYPQLYEIIKSQRYKVKSITPKLKQYRFTVYDRESGKTLYFKKLKTIADKYNISYKYLKQYKQICWMHNRFKVRKVQIDDTANDID